MQYPLKHLAKIAKRFGKRYPAVALLANHGDPVFACDDGIVVHSFYDPEGYGEIVKIKHRDNIVTVYCHLAEGSRRHERGDKVKKGDQIGEVGKSGVAGYPQLRFEIMVNGAYINPSRYFDIVMRNSLPKPASAAAEPTEDQEYLVHQVADGETLTAISKKYKTSLSALKKLNGLARAADIKPGQQIKIRKREGK